MLLGLPRVKDADTFQVSFKSEDARKIVRDLYTDYQREGGEGLTRDVVRRAFPGHDWDKFGHSDIKVVSYILEV